MSTSRDPRYDLHGPGSGKEHGGHRWLMLACCVPMVVIAIVLVVTDVVGIGALVAAVACAAMMTMMMRGMGHGDGSRG
ncbi:hypothetical protein [Amycolatopsis sp. TNS106]|uniref:hypothetical protein n=1 Tax=Amycolatopsis sp. TNS106 TaxID=2861750 RepID=UPI001C5A0E8D|nr:hypothetical protein [Amycolatopsis sp. TNS106]